jgi:hypothetical protein
VQLINKVFVYAMARYFVVNNQTMGVLGRRNGAKLHDRFFHDLPLKICRDSAGCMLEFTISAKINGNSYAANTKCLAIA